MKPITLGWDAPASPVDRYEVRWFFGSVEIGSVNTLDTEATLWMQEPGEYRFEVKAVFEDVASASAVLTWWVEELYMYPPVLRDNGIILSWPTVAGRVYEMDVSYDGNTWTPVLGRHIGDGKTAEAGGDVDHPSARYRVWSRPS